MKSVKTKKLYNSEGYLKAELISEDEVYNEDNGRYTISFGYMKYHNYTKEQVQAFMELDNLHFESELWAKVKELNEESVWITEDGEFCPDFEYDFADREVADWERNVIPWLHPGFNGCWSCNKTTTCKKVLNDLKRKK